VQKKKYVKACPFLRDLGDSYLCVNDDKVVDVILDPLMNIEWSDEIPPVASEVEGSETCLFVLEIKEDDRLYCCSRKMYLKMDNHFIRWEDIRDSLFLLELDSQNEYQNAEFDFCSTCLYKVLVASSPAFQTRLSFDEKIKLGIAYILNKANEIYTGLILLSKSLAKDNQIEGLNDKIKHSKAIIFKQQISALSLLTWIVENGIVDELYASTTFEWLQKFDEWGLIVSSIADAETNEEKIALVKESFEFAARLKELSYELIVKLSLPIGEKEEELKKPIKIINKIITIAAVQLEDYMFICNQFFSILKIEKEGEK